MATSYPNITNAEEYEKFLSSGASLITFGNPSGTFVSLQPGDTANQLVQFSSGDVINSIQIGNITYGVPGDNLSQPYRWSTTGRFILQSLWAGDGDNNQISNMTFVIGTDPSQPSITIGSDSCKSIVLDLSVPYTGITVTLASIMYGDYINQLSFQIVS